jgi:hypothetical protein
VVADGPVLVELPPNSSPRHSPTVQIPVYAVWLIFAEDSTSTHIKKRTTNSLYTTHETDLVMNAEITSAMSRKKIKEIENK